MSLQTDQLPPKWRRWVSSVLPDASPEKVCVTLVDEGFTAAQIINAMGKHFPKHITLPDNAAFYHQHANPKVLNNPNCVQLCPNYPLYKVDNVFSAPECERISEIVKQRLEPSKILGEQIDEYEDYRTSKTCYLHTTEDPFVDTIEDRLWNLVSPQRGGGETVQAQFYEQGEYYKPHHDFFAPGTDKYKQSAGAGGQRTWTCMVYITCPKKGGGTHFIEPNITIKPTRGSAILWNNLHPNGATNFGLKHQALPVESGEKLILTKWFRTRKCNQNQRVSVETKKKNKSLAHFLKK